MKKGLKYFSLMAMMVIGLASCSNELTSNIGDSSPRVLIADYANVNSDTVHYGVNSDNTAYTLDSIQVGDTLSVYLVAYSNFGYLTKIYTTVSDSNYLKLLEPNDSVKEMYSSSSDFKTGELYLDESNVSYITYVTRVIPIKESDKVALTIGAANEAADVSNAYETKIEFPIKARKK